MPIREVNKERSLSHNMVQYIDVWPRSGGGGGEECVRDSRKSNVNTVNHGSGTLLRRFLLCACPRVYSVSA